MFIIEAIAFTFFGACIGSFLNVCIFRLPRNQSIITPGSFCRNCKTPIKWHDNIPMFSYIFLKGRCRNCKERISIRYPFVELITAVLFLALYLKFGFSIELVKYCFLFSLLIMVSFIDIDYHAIPAHLCFLGIVFGLAISVFSSLELLKTGGFEPKTLPIVRSGIGLLFGFGFTYMFKFFGDIGIDIYLKLRKKESIEGETESLGLGDVDFMGMVGVYLGVPSALVWGPVVSVLLVFFLAPFFAMVYSVIALIFKKSHLIPYLPYLSLATLAVFFWGEEILKFVSRLILI